MAARYFSQRTGRWFVPSYEDLLWAGRGAMGEGINPPQKIEALLWAMTNRLLLTNVKFPGTKRQPTYGEMWRLFSTPVNPIWDGIEGNEWGDTKEKCVPGKHYWNTEFCAAKVLERRETMRNLEWDDFPQVLKSKLIKFQAGYLFPPDEFATKTDRSRITNWGRADLKQREYKDGPLKPITELFPHGFRLGGEWFFEDPYVRKGTVEVDADPNMDRSRPEGQQGSILLPIALTLVAGGALGLVATALYQALVSR